MKITSSDVAELAIPVERRSNKNDTLIERKKLSHLSFRLENRVIELLREEAVKRGISSSSLVNKILKDYVTSEMYFEELGFMLVSKEFLREILCNVDEMKLEEIGMELGLKVAKEYVSYFYSVVNCETLVKFLDLLFRRFQSFQHRVESKKESVSGESLAKRRSRHYFAVNHEINYNFSVILSAMLQGLIESVIRNEVKFRMVTANSLIFTFEMEELLDSKEH